MKNRTIVLTGGGTGGHITPILAVARELKRLRPDLRLVYIGERRGKFAELIKDNPDIDVVHTIFAGKFRRYHGESWLKRLLNVKDHLLNLRDAIYVTIGVLQSWRLLGHIQPDLVFQKGGFVGMPVGLAAARRRIPLVTHDSDALPGLANRVVGRWAKIHATGMPAEYYRYPKDRVRHVGVLVSQDYASVTPTQQKAFRNDLDVPADSQVLFVTGGSHGARPINEALAQVLPALLDTRADLYVLHQVGKGNIGVYEGYSNPRLRAEEFLTGMYRYSGAADVVVTRAGANTMAEFGVQGKACIVVPNPRLTGGHQLKNSEYLLQQEAVMVVDEHALATQPELLGQAIQELLDDAGKRQRLARNLQAITITDATQRLARLLLETAE